MTLPDHIRDEILRLRKEERLGPGRIAARLGIAKSTAHAITRLHPLTEEERAASYTSGAAITTERRVRYRPNPSTVAQARAEVDLSRQEVHSLALHAVEQRLIALGHLERGAHLERLAEREGDSGAPYAIPGTPLRVYIRTTQRRLRDGVVIGRPFCPLRDPKSFRRYTAAACDAVLGYDLQTDTVHVFMMSEFGEHQETVIRERTREGWHLLGLAPEPVRPSAVRPRTLAPVLRRPPRRPRP